MSLYPDFEHELEVTSNLLNYNVQMIQEQVEALSSRTMIRKELAKWHNRRISLEEVRDFTQPKYVDGASVYEKILFSYRFDIQKNRIAYYDPADTGFDLERTDGSYFFQTGDCYLYIVNNPIREKGELIGVDSAAFHFCDWSNEEFTFLTNPAIIDEERYDPDFSSYASTFPIGTSGSYLYAQLDQNILDREIKTVARLLLKQAFFILAAIVLISYFTIFRLVRNLLKSLKELNDRAIAQERSAAIGQISAGMDHDFNNLLMGIIGYSDLLKFSSDLPSSLHPAVEKILHSGLKAKVLITKLTDYGRKNVTLLKPVDLKGFSERVVKEQKQKNMIEIQFQSDVTNVLPVFVDSNQLGQAFENIIQNAVDAGSTLLKIRLFKEELTHSDSVNCTICSDAISGEWYCLSFQDNGPGLNPSYPLEKFFEPFFTTRGISSNTGLGLSQVMGIINQNKGHLRVNNRTRRGDLNL